MSLCLTPEEVLEITGYKRPADQLRALQARGIPAARRPDGSVSVIRVHLAMQAPPAPQSAEPQLRPIHG